MSDSDPIEVAPLQAPVVPQRVLPVDYSMHGGGYAVRTRPPIVAAMGTIAIVISILSLLASAVAGIAALGMMVATQMSAATSARMATVAAAKPPPIPGVIVTGKRGFNQVQRNVVMHILRTTQPLSPQQETQLERLLARNGQDIMPFVDRNSPSPQLVRANISDSGRIVAYQGGERAVYFVIGTGKLEIYSDRAVFFPNTPGAQAIRIQDGIDPDDDDGAAVTTTVAPPMPPASPFAIRPAASALTIVEAILSALLAVYLLVVGILLMRQNSHARGLQLAFALIKIPLAILCAVAWMWAISDSYTSTAGPGAVAPPSVSVWFVIFLMVGLAYPVSLLFVLRSRAVKEYYSAPAVQRI